MQRLESRTLTKHNAEMRPIKFIGRASQKVTAKIHHINQSMRRELHGIDVDDRPCCLRHLGEGLNVVDTTRKVAGVVQREQSRAIT